MAESPDEIQSQIIMIKRKRTKRSRPTSVSTSSTNTGDCSSSSVEEEEEEEELLEDRDLAKCLILLAQGKTEEEQSICSSVLVSSHQDHQSLFVYQCKTCDRCFSSFQALGGHRASHKKPKIIQNPQLFSSNNSIQLSLQLSTAGNDAVKSKVHECSVCGAEFSSGQALGGHMRRHRALTATAPPPRVQELVIKKERNVLELDLNLPAPEEDRHRTAVAVFSAASPMVDCHY